MAGNTYVLIAPWTPGATPREVFEGSLRECRNEAAKYAARRPDIKRGVDLRIDRCVGRKNGSRDVPDGRPRVFVEYF